MRINTNPILLGIVICFVFGTLQFSFQSCKKDRSTTDQLGSPGISSDEFAPSWSPDGTRIVFASARDNNRGIYTGIYTMNADGSNQIRLTDDTTNDEAPSWSPDGTRIIFHSNRDGNMEIYAMNADGSNQIRLTDNPAADKHPSWSSDDMKIVFESNRDGNREIYIMNADGSNPIRLTDNTTIDAEPSWSPDGTGIIFCSNRDGNWEIYAMNSDGSHQARLTDNPAYDTFPSLSPDGNRIVFVSSRDDIREIYTMNADGSNLTRLTNEPTSDFHPSWSPDGLKIAFISMRDFDREVYVMDTDGSNTVNLTNNAPVNEAFGLTPLPQSELDLEAIPYKLVFQSLRETNGRENWEICMIDADGSNLINLTNTPEIDEENPHASPDGSLVCFTADEGEDKQSKSRNIYYMNIDGTDRVKVAENAQQPCWSPDGKYIAYPPGEYPRYDPSFSANKGIEIYNLETREVKRHPNDEIFHIRDLCWSPDGEWFVSKFTYRGNKAFKVDGSAVMGLSTVGCTADISSDGKRLAWNGTNKSLNIGKLDFDSPQSNVFDHRLKVACERDFWIFRADWSPDDNYLAFTYGFDDEDNQASTQERWSHVCICDLKTGKWTQITIDGKYNEHPDWVVVKADGL